MGVVDRSCRDAEKSPSPIGQPNTASLILVSGPSRSGKSRWAEHLAESSGLPVTYLATGSDRPEDGAWQQRLQLHRQRRPPHWTTLEVGGELEHALESFKAIARSQAGLGLASYPGTRTIHDPSVSGAQEPAARAPVQLSDDTPRPSPPEQLLLIDSLGTWLAHHLELDEPGWLLRQERLLTALDNQAGPVVFVCEEVGWGLVPPTAIGGLFRDRSGSLQQRLMQQAQGAWLVVQGRALNLMALGEAVPPA